MESGKLPSPWGSSLEYGRNGSSFLSISCARLRTNNAGVLRLGSGSTVTIAHSRTVKLGEKGGNPGTHVRYTFELDCPNHWVLRSLTSQPDMLGQLLVNCVKPVSWRRWIGRG
jgi:hypothetical protein